MASLDESEQQTNHHYQNKMSETRRIINRLEIIVIVFPTKLQMTMAQECTECSIALHYNPIMINADAQSFMTILLATRAAEY